MTLYDEFAYYLAHEKELLAEFAGKVLVIKEQTVIGVFASELEALQKTLEAHELGTFLIQRCESGATEVVILTYLARGMQQS